MKSYKSIIISILLPLLLSFCGCAETPSEDIVTNKGDGALEDKIENSEGAGLEIDSEISAETDEPDLHTVFTSSSGNVTFTVNADITYPDVDAFPVLKAETHFFTSEELEQLSSVLCMGNPIYEYSEELTKSEIETEILEIRQFIGDRDYLMDYYDGDEEIIALVVSDYERRLAALETAYLTAPDTPENIPTDFQFHEDSYYSSSYSPISGIDGIQSFKAVSEANGIPMFIWAAQRNDDEYILSNYSLYIKNQETGEERGSYYQTDNFTDKDLAEAVTLVENTLVEAGFEEWGIRSHEIYEHSAVFICIPEYHGIAMSPDQNWGALSIDFLYTPMYTYPSLRITISNGQIMEFTIEGILEATEILNENVALMPYTEILDRIYDQLELSWTETRVRDWLLSGVGAEPISAAVDVSRIELTLVRVSVQNYSDSYYIMPAWMVYGSVSLTEYKLMGQTVTEPITEPMTDINAEMPLLVINAIDGSVIDMSQGY